MSPSVVAADDTNLSDATAGDRMGIDMGVDHGGQGGHVPPEFGVGDDNANFPPQILSYKYKNERSVAFKIRRSPFSAVAPPGPRWGAHDAPPDPLVGKRGHPYPTRHQSTFGPRHACVPRRSLARSTTIDTQTDLMVCPMLLMHWAD